MSVFANALTSYLKTQFPMYHKNFRVIDEERMYRPKEDKVIFNRVKDNRFFVAEIWLMFDDSSEFVAEVHSEMTKPQVDTALFAGLQNLKSTLEKKQKAMLF